MVCGHSLQDGDNVVIIDDLMSTGLTLCERIDQLKELANINIAAVIVIADLTNDEAIEKGWGPQMLEQKYGAKVYSVITENDIVNVQENRNL